MDPPRRKSIIDPKIRHVGFFTPPPSQPLDTSLSLPLTSFSPLTIPPTRHASDNFQPPSRPVGVPVPNRRNIGDDGDLAVVGSYNPGEESVLGTSCSGFSTEGEFVESSKYGLGEFSEESGNWVRKSDDFAGNNLVEKVPEVSDKGFGKEKVAKISNDLSTTSKPLKEKTSKAERRALQEAQRAAKAGAKGGGKKSASGGVAVGHEAVSNNVKQPIQKKDSAHVALSEKKGGEKLPQKDKKKDALAVRMQFDDKSRVEKAKRHSLVKQSEAKNRVEMFRHLPQYEHGNQGADLEANFFQHESMHAAVYKVGLQYLSGDVSGGNARCIAMLKAFSVAIRDYNTPPEKAFSRDLTAKINSYISFLIECRPLSISMGNAIRFLKARIAKLPLNLSESEAKTSLCSDIDNFINDKIILADKVIVRHAVTKIKDGDVLLTYGSSSVVEMILLYAHELGKQFRVVVVDSRPKLEGEALLRRLVGKGIGCTYTHINALSYIMHEVTTVFLGAASVFSNGTVYSRVGTACVAMVANAFKVPVLICCEAYKFHERVLLDSICSNELGDSLVIAKVKGRMDVNFLKDWTRNENLQLLNLLYDATPSDYISMIITDYGMIPPTSVPVIVREYGKEHLFV